MKKLLTGITILFISMVTFMPIAKAQITPFSGTILFDVKVEGDIPEQAKSMMPTEMTYKISTDKQIMLMNFGMMEQKTVYDAVKQEDDMMMNFMGQKFIIKNSASQINALKKKEGETTAVKLTTDTKTIAGFVCKKAIVTMKSKDDAQTTFNVYYTDDIDVSRYKFSNLFPEINGLPLEFTMKVGPMSFNMVARNIRKESIPDSVFVIDTDCKEVTTEELRNMFGGTGQ